MFFEAIQITAMLVSALTRVSREIREWNRLLKTSKMEGEDKTNPPLSIFFYANFNYFLHPINT